MRYLIYLFLACTLWAQSPNPDLQVGSFQYNEQVYPTNVCPANNYSCLNATLAGQMYWVTQGNFINLQPYESNLIWNDYEDSGGTYVSGVYQYIIDPAAAMGWDHEAMILHAVQDYSPQTGDSWFNIDCFDVFDQPYSQAITGNTGTCSTAQHGVFLFNGSYADRTGAIYAGTCATNCVIANTNIMYFGYAEPFDQINFTLGTFMSGGAVSWQYWNGTVWTTLTVTDGTKSGAQPFGQNGQVYFVPPTDWALTPVNSSHTKFWVRVTVSGSPTTAPKIMTAKGDAWAASGSYTQRGWNSSTCVSGLITMTYNSTQYCPNPLTTGATPASAKFKYQSRFNAYPPSGTSFRNYVYYNPSHIVGGEYTSVAAGEARWVIQRSYHANSPNGVMFDNVNGQPTTATPAWNNGNFTDLVCAPACTSTSWQTYFQAYMSQMNTDMKAAFPALTHFGGNVISPTNFVGLLDFEVLEQAASQPDMGDMQFHIATNGTLAAYLPANNPSGTKLAMGMWDNQHFGLTIPAQAGQSASNHVWNQADRTNMDTLASYYIVIPFPNTYFVYNDQGYSYFATDEVYEWQTSPTTTLSAPLAIGTTCAGTFTVTSSASLQIIGGPEYPSTYVLLVGGVDVFGGTFSGNTFTIKGGSGCSGGNFGHATQNWTSGTTVQFALVQHWSNPSLTAPTNTNVWYYANYWKAMQIDLGIPNTAGWNGGVGDLAYLTGNNASTHGSCGGTGGNACSPVWRRDFTCPSYGGHCVVLVRSFQSISYPSELETPSPVINLIDHGGSPDHKLFGPYYLLHGDGTTSGPISSITLTAGTAAILLTNPTTPGSIMITTSSLPSCQVNAPYGSTLTASGGVGALTWSISSGSLPATLSLNSSTGFINGTCTGTSGTYNFVVEVCDTIPNCATAPLSIVINALPLTINTTSLPGAIINTPYSAQLVGSGGSGSYIWGLILSTLPTGLSLNSSTGVISGTPTGVGKSFRVTLQDTAGDPPAQAPLAISVTSINLTYNTSSRGSTTSRGVTNQH